MPYINIGKENSGDIQLYFKEWGSGPARGLQSRLATGHRRHIALPSCLMWQRREAAVPWDDGTGVPVGDYKVLVMRLAL